MQFSDYVDSSGRLLCAPLAGLCGKSLTGSSVKENLHDGVLQARTITALQNEMDFDIVFPMMDLTVESEAFGASIDWNIDELPSVKGIRVSSEADVEEMAIPEIGRNNRLSIFVEVCDILRENFVNKPVWAYVLGPFSIAGRLMGMTEIAVATKLEPEVVHATLRKVTDFLLKYTDVLLNTGVDGVMVLEPASGMLRADSAEEFSNSYIKEIVSLIKSRGKTASLHNCGTINHLVEGLCATGIEALHVGSVTNLREIYPRVPENVVVMGNLDPTNVFLRGNPELVKAAARQLIGEMADCRRFVISSGCDVPPGASLGNLAALKRVMTGREYLLEGAVK